MNLFSLLTQGSVLAAGLGIASYFIQAWARKIDDSIKQSNASILRLEGKLDNEKDRREDLKNHLTLSIGKMNESVIKMDHLSKAFEGYIKVQEKRLYALEKNQEIHYAKIVDLSKSFEAVAQWPSESNS